MHYGHPLVLPPGGVPPQQKSFDLVFIRTGSQFPVSKTPSQIGGCIVVGMVAVRADNAEEGPLVWSIGTIWVVTAVTFL